MSVYFHSAVFVLSALTTVGYGTIGYNTEVEFIFVMFMECLSILILAINLSVIAVIINIQEDDFMHLAQKRMDQMHEWLIKLQRKGEGAYLNVATYSNIDYNIEEAFLKDFNMIVEEFPFYDQLTKKMQTDLIQ